MQIKRSKRRNDMRFGSVCSGIEAASVAWHPLGWQAAWLSEIEPFPSAVLAHHYPDTPNLGDMTTLPERIKSGEVEAPDLFCGGTPCQAFSVAGLRNSLDDDRGNLSLTFVEIANAIDNRRQNLGHVPAIIFWENVPGVLSTKDNAFGCFLGALAGEDEPVIPAGDKWTNAGCVYGPQRTVAWRVLDAQYFGVAQRRRRVFVVASARDEFDPVKVLFESEGVRRDTAPSREKREAVAASAGASAAFGGMSPVAGTLTANTGGMTRPAGNANELDFCVPMGCEFGPSGGRLTDLNPTLDTRAKDGPVRNQLAGAVLTMAHGQGGAEIATDRAPTLTCNQAPIAVYGILGNWIGRKPENGGNATTPMHDIAPCLTKTDVHGVARPIAFHPTQTPISSTDGSTHALGCGSSHGQASVAVAQSMQVRRLTPVECERLQGFPDGYTNIPWRKKEESPDGPRYKALGNSWAVPVVRWIGQRIQAAIQ